MEQSEGKREVGEHSNGLQMAPEQMLDLAHKAAELVVERIDGLPRENAWEGEFRHELENWLVEEPPEAGRPAAEVLEQGRARYPPHCDAAGPSALLWVCPDQRPLGPECWPISWPPDTTPTPALGWSPAARANWNW